MLMAMAKNKIFMAYDRFINKDFMHLRCPEAADICTTIIKGYSLAFRGDDFRAMANIEPKKGGVIPVMLYSISERDENEIDCFIGFPKYYRKETFVTTIGGEPVYALAYVLNIMDRKTEEIRLLGLPHKSYLKTMREGYDMAGLDQKYIDDAVWSVNKMRL